MPEPLTPPPPRPTPAAATVTLRGDAVLLIRRGRPPNAGIWSLPGGSVEPGESVRETAARETLEETGIAVEIGAVIDVVDVIVPATADHPAFHYVITDFLAVPTSDAAPRPGDDAAESRWVPLAELDRYDLTSAMRAVLDRALRLSSSPPHNLTPSPVVDSSTVRTLGEFGLIERLAQIVKQTEIGHESTIVVGLGDDAAVLAPPRDRQLVATIDTLIEEIHFRRDWTGAEDLGWKSLAVNVSDVAAMGAEPWVALVSLALPASVPVGWVEALYRGLADCALYYGCAIVGGDTVGAPRNIAVTVAVLGTALPEEIRLRGGARPGDLICVTGTLGDSGAGLALLQVGYRPEDTPQWQSLFRAHLHPEPPVAASRALAREPAVSAMMDLSDGLASDLRHICEQSGVGARVLASSIPISQAARGAADALGRDPADWALRGGEDYQILFTIDPEHAEKVAGLAAETGVTFTVIGEITASGYLFMLSDGRQEPLSPSAFDHFAG
jgi:thiamine-monophosphate kinase